MHARGRKTDNVIALVVPGRRAWMIKLPQFKILLALQIMIFEDKILLGMKFQ